MIFLLLFLYINHISSFIKSIDFTNTGSSGAILNCKLNKMHILLLINNN
jgi:hypothetical protein